MRVRKDVLPLSSHDNIVAARANDSIPPRRHDALEFVGGELGGADIEFRECEYVEHEHGVCAEEEEVFVCNIGDDDVSDDVAMVGELGSV